AGFEEPLERAEHDRVAKRQVGATRINPELHAQWTAEGEVRVEPVGGDYLGGAAPQGIVVGGHRADATSGPFGFRRRWAVTGSAYPLGHKVRPPPRNAKRQRYARADGEGPRPRLVRGARPPGRRVRPSPAGRPAGASARPDVVDLRERRVAHHRPARDREPRGPHRRSDPAVGPGRDRRDRGPPVL